MFFRTKEEIIGRIKSYQGSFHEFDLLECLPLDDARLLAKIDLDEWLKKEGKTWEPRKRVDVVNEMQRYMPFAIEKATDHRGLSAGRSIEHYQNWLWLICDDDIFKFAEDESNYPNYGAPVLKKIAQKYGYDWSV